MNRDFVTIYNVEYDLASMVDVNVKALGNVRATLADGQEWLISNVASAASMDMGPSSQGLRISHNTLASQYDESIASAPLVALPITATMYSDVSQIAALAGLRVTVAVNFIGIANDDDTICFAIDTINGGTDLLDPMNLQRYEWSRRKKAGTVGTLKRLLCRGVNEVMVDDVVTPNNEAVYQIEVPLLGHSQAFLRTCNNSVQGMTSPYGYIKPRNEMFKDGLNPVLDLTGSPPNQLAVVLGVSETSGLGTMTATFTSLRIEALLA